MGERKLRELAVEVPELAADLPAVIVDPPDRTFEETAAIVSAAAGSSFATSGGAIPTTTSSRSSPTRVLRGRPARERAPPWFGDGFPLDWPETASRLLELVRGPVVPGHGDVGDRRFVEDQLAALHAVAELGRRVHRGELSLDDGGGRSLRRQGFAATDRAGRGPAARGARLMDERIRLRRPARPVGGTRSRRLGPWLGAAFALAVLTALAGCGGQADDSALVLRVGPPSDATTVAAAAEGVEARLAGLDVGGLVVIDEDLLRLDLPPARPGPGLVAQLTDQRKLRLLALPTGDTLFDSDTIDPSWDLLLEAKSAVPTTVEADATGAPALAFTFSGADAERLAAETSTRVGEFVALAFGDEVVAVPLIQVPIRDGRMTLTLVNDGHWSAERLRELAALVSSGPLPAQVVEVPGG
jgi:hypothetical protein